MGVCLVVSCYGKVEVVGEAKPGGRILETSKDNNAPGEILSRKRSAIEQRREEDLAASFVGSEVETVE